MENADQLDGVALKKIPIVNITNPYLSSGTYTWLYPVRSPQTELALCRNRILSYTSVMTLSVSSRNRSGYGTAVAG